MKVYHLSGFCFDATEGQSKFVAEIFNSEEMAEKALAEYVEFTHNLAEDIKDLAGVNKNNSAYWTERKEKFHNSTHVLTKYSANVSAKLSDENALVWFREYSYVSLFRNNSPQLSLADGIVVNDTYQYVNFEIANLNISVKEI